MLYVFGSGAVNSVVLELESGSSTVNCVLTISQNGSGAVKGVFLKLRNGFRPANSVLWELDSGFRSVISVFLKLPHGSEQITCAPQGLSRLRPMSPLSPRSLLVTLRGPVELSLHADRQRNRSCHARVDQPPIGEGPQDNCRDEYLQWVGYQTGLSSWT